MDLVSPSYTDCRIVQLMFAIQRLARRHSFHRFHHAEFHGARMNLRVVIIAIMAT